MRLRRFFTISQSGILKLTLITLIILTSLALNAQTPADFSGKWEFDKIRSDKAERGDTSFKGKIILEIKQTVSTITLFNIYYVPDKGGIKMFSDIYSLDGKITTDNSGTGPAKKSSKWSADKKTLTTSLIMTDSVDGKKMEFLTANTYQLADGGKSLIVVELNKSEINGERKTKKVYSLNSK